MKKSLWTVGLVALAILFYFVFALQQIQVKSKDDDSVASVARQLVERELLPSISYAVVSNGEIVEVETLGIADMATGEVAHEDTIYEAASLTKPVVAEISRRLHREGIFDLDEKIADTVSNDRVVNEKLWSKLTPRHLLSHTSGLPNWSGDSRDPDRADELDFDFEPGSEFQYSGEGYGILLAFLEIKSGKRAENLAKALFDELGMKNSTLVGSGHPGDFARGHWGSSPDREAWKTSGPVAAYSLFTNARDYALFLKYVMNRHATGLLDGDPFVAVHSNVIASQRNSELGWSLGWGVLQRRTEKLYFQWGDNGPFRSFAAFDPVKGNGLLYFTNGSYGTIYADELAAPLFGDIRLVSTLFGSEPTEIARTWLKF